MLGVLRSAQRLSALAAAPALSAGMLGSFVRCHCQVPCGIFDDPMRVQIIKEDAATIRKSMVQINELAGQSTPLAFNQASRWVAVKEASASNIMSVVADYMLAQRVKKELFENSSDYLSALEAHHTVLQAAMKTKQVVDVSACDKLDNAIVDVGKMYIKE
mmetsp:Transcript_18016/g.58966  ORF Transcript_18016/g.58966 Transcript_18016/m.58966 type:complete len:160 (+) Transcript_18016:42-521(+)